MEILVVLVVIILYFVIRNKSKKTDKTKETDKIQETRKEWKKYAHDERYQETPKPKEKIVLDSHNVKQIKTKSLLNEQEYYILCILQQAVAKSNENYEEQKFYLSSQVSCGAFLSSVDSNDEDELWKSYSSLYVDFLIFERKTKEENPQKGKNNIPIMVLEFHGYNHFAKDDDVKNVSIKRNDANKRILFKAQGINFFEIKYENYPYRASNSLLDFAAIRKKVDMIMEHMIAGKQAQNWE